MKFCAYILSHGRADNVKTYRTLRKCGYTGDICIVIDDEDEEAERYFENFDNVEQFSKDDIAARFDQADMSNDRRAVFYARNACFDIAESQGVTHFVELDDDYSTFEYRYEKDGKLKTVECKQLDRLFQDMCEFLDASNAKTVAFCQGGDFIGGVGNTRLRQRVLRKAMNTFFCKTENRFPFVGRVNEDVNTYCSLGMRGQLFLSIVDVDVVQGKTQSNKGGMSGLYVDNGTYEKSFYTVMMCPSCVTIRAMGDKHKRLHHNVDWERCVPKILNEKWKR